MHAIEDDADRGWALPFRKDWPSSGSNFALVPGSRVLKIDPKSWLTFSHVFSRASRFFSSNSSMTCQIRKRLQTALKR